MPGRGIPNRMMVMAPFVPSWFKSFNQKQMPNNTDFVFYDYDSMDKEMKLISEEVDKLGIHGAYKAY